MTEYIPSRENLAALISADTHLSREWIKLPANWDRTEEAYRKRIWTCIKAYREDHKEQGVSTLKFDKTDPVKYEFLGYVR